MDGTLPQGAASDHVAFQQEGFAAVMLFEDTADYSPFIHSANDVVGQSFNSPALAEKITRAAAATLAAMAIPATAGPGPTPTPTPDPGNPGGDPGMDTVHGSCACTISSDAKTPSATLLAAAIFIAWLATRRRDGLAANLH